MSRKRNCRNSQGYHEIVEEAYVCCEEFDFLWDKNDLPIFQQMWKEGQSVFRIAELFKRKPQEVLFLIIDQYEVKAIKNRPGGIWGKEQG